MPDLLALAAKRLKADDYNGPVTFHYRHGDFTGKYETRESHDVSELLATATSAPADQLPCRDLAPATRATAPVPSGAGNARPQQC